jgi:hypothetical protein
MSCDVENPEPVRAHARQADFVRSNHDRFRHILIERLPENPPSLVAVGLKDDGLTVRRPLGQRVEGMAVDAFQHGEWATVAEATSVGACRICRTSGAVETDRVRLRITRSPVSPVLAEFGLFASG